MMTTTQVFQHPLHDMRDNTDAIRGNTDAIRANMEGLRGELRGEISGARDDATMIFQTLRSDLKQLQADIRQDVNAVHEAYQAGALQFGCWGLLVGLILGMFITGKNR